LTTPADDEHGPVRTYVLVVICEVAVIGGLWLLSRYYG
jgi:hypothetical protein